MPHVIKPYETAVTLFGRDGGVWSYPSKKAALKALGKCWISEKVGTHFREYRESSLLWSKTEGHYLRIPIYAYSEFIMRDDFGQPLTWADFRVLPTRRIFWRYPKLENWNGEGPVPGVQRHRGYHYFRRPGTTQERRQSFAVREEGEPAPRAGRNATNLPNSYDDIGRSSAEGRNWKRYRSHQWRG